MDDLVLNIKQISQYPRAASVKRGDVFLLQQDVTGAGPLGGPYACIDPLTLMSTILAAEGWLQLSPYPTGGIAFNGASLTFHSGAFTFSEDVIAPTIQAGEIFVAGDLPVADRPYVDNLFATLVANTVHSVNGRTGDVQLTAEDIMRAGAAPIWSPHFGGHVTAPTPWNVYANDETVATVQWVQQWACTSGLVVSSINGRGGAVTLNADDITIALTTTPGTYGQANTPPLGDASRRIANTLFVDNAIEDLRSWTIGEFETYAQIIALGYAPLNSPNFTGVPTAPTANLGNNTGQIATTAFVAAAVAASTAGVATFNGRTGNVVLDSADLVTAGAATLNSPAFVGTPSAPTPAPGNNSNQLATTAFVDAAVAAVNAGVLSFNGRTGAISLTTADVTAVGGALLASPAFTGTPTAPTPAPGTNTGAIATTSYVQQAIGALPAPVTSFNGRTGAIALIGADVSAAGGALTASPAFTGTPTAPTALTGTNSTQLATCAFVQAAVTSATAGVSTWNGRSGAVTMSLTDVTGVGGAPLASPTFTGTPAAPTATQGTNSTQLATCAFVQAALAAAPGGVSSFNTRTGAITLNSGDISAAGGALIASPTFTGTPAAPTAGPGTATTQLATTAFVMTALASGGGVSSFNGRAGNITLTAADLTSAGGALLTSPAFTGAPTAPTAAPATNNTQLATTAFVTAAIAAQQPVVTQADVAPALNGNALWFDSVGGQLYVQYVDPSTQAKSWVIANSPQTPPSPAPTSGNRVLLNSTVIGAAVASVSWFTGFDGTYDELELVLLDTTLSAEAGFGLRFSFDGSTFLSAAGSYYFGNNYSGTANSASGASTSTQMSFGASITGSSANLAAYHVARLRINTVVPTPSMTYQGIGFNVTNGVFTIVGGGRVQSAQAGPPLGLQLIPNSGNITKGTFKLFGIVK